MTAQGLYNSTVSASSASGADVIDAYSGSSTITLGSGSDTVNINTQNESGTGYSGASDSITAGSGQDNVYFIGLSQANATISNNGAGTTTVVFGAETVSITASSVAGSHVDLWFTDGKVNGG